MDWGERMLDVLAKSFVRRTRRPNAVARVYCFGHSGAGPSELVRWLDEWLELEVVGFTLPGRGSRVSEAPAATMEDVMRVALSEIEIRPPYAFVGHSMGALVAHELALRLEALAQEPPSGIVVSSCYPPGQRPGKTNYHRLPDGELLDTLEREYGDSMKPLRDDPALAQILLPALRADLRIVETWTPSGDRRVSSPILAIAGVDEAQSINLSSWFDYGSNLRVAWVPGGHFHYRYQPSVAGAAVRSFLMSHV